MKQIIILDSYREQDKAGLNIVCAFWFSMPVARRVPLPEGGSAYTGATPAEIAAIKSGAILEEVHQFRVVNTPAAQVKLLLQDKYSKRLDDLTTTPSPKQFYGVSWDGTTWS